MKEYNIIEAVEYLKNNYNADVYLKDKSHIKLKLDSYYSSAEYEVYICNSMQETRTKMWASMVLDKWIIPETETPQRTHAEIMKNWFYPSDSWFKVEGYSPEKSKYYFIDKWRDKEFFNDLEMKTDQEMQEMAE
jgi:hypothetical protein